MGTAFLMEQTPKWIGTNLNIINSYVVYNLRGTDLVTDNYTIPWSSFRTYDNTSGYQSDSLEAFVYVEELNILVFVYTFYCTDGESGISSYGGYRVIEIGVK